ncbi:MAG: aspartate kinase [Bacteroidales bacterium]|nr:aspartate kinase [Bacteroidales bacterium]
MIVQKFGGTSVGNADRIKNLLNLIQTDKPNIVVLSAVSGTTNKLVEITENLYQQDKNAACQNMEALQKEYFQLVDELYDTENKKSEAIELVKAHFTYLKRFTERVFTILQEKAVLAQGELLSTALFQGLLEERSINSVLLPALDFMRIDKNLDPDEYYIKENLNRILKNNANTKLFVTQGYICRNAYGEIDNLKRGGSDYTASLIGQAIQAEEIQIWTDIDGLHNNDPRYVKNTQPVANLSFEEAAELAYYGAKILHPSSILPAKKADIPVRLKNSLNPNRPGTIIQNSTPIPGIKAIAAKDNITVVRIKSDRMLFAYGFLRKVFEVFEIYKTPIDMITTSEVAVSMSIDDTTHLNDIMIDLKKFGQVEITPNQVIIAMVGYIPHSEKGYASKVFDALLPVPIHMISYGASNHNISLIIDQNNKLEALNALHLKLYRNNEA